MKDSKLALYRRLFIIGTLLTLSFLSTAVASNHPYISKHGVVFSTGNKYLTESDFTLSSPVQSISFRRSYNSQSSEVGPFGHGWSMKIAHLSSLIINADNIILVEGSGRRVQFLPQGTNTWVNRTDRIRTITLSNSIYTLTNTGGSARLFDSSGKITEARDRNNNSIFFTYTSEQLSSISDQFGHQVTFTYSSNLINSMSTPVGTFIYIYTGDNLTTVQKPDGSTRQYLYEDTNDIHNLTGIIDENNIRISTTGYDNQDRVISSSLADGVSQITIDYPDYNVRTITNSEGLATTYQLVFEQGVARVKSFTGPGCSSCGGGDGDNATYETNDRQQVTQKTVTNAGVDVITKYEYDTNGNRTKTIEAFGTSDERTTTWTYEPDSNRIATVTKGSVANPGQDMVTTLTYHPSGNLWKRQEDGYSDPSASISRTTEYIYNSYGQIESIDGPRTDVNDTVSMTYYPNESSQGNNRAQLNTVTNALGHIVTYSDYNSFGKATTITDANGVATTFNYDPDNGRLNSQTRLGLTTSYVYYPNGNLKEIHLPGSRVILYTYTDSGLLERITDSLGNYLKYIYDTEGRKTGEEVYDPTDQLKRYVNYEYNDSGRLEKVINADTTFSTYTYDGVGNLISRFNELNKETTYDYDALNRLTSITEPGTIITGFGYNTNDDQVSVTDANSNSTTFEYDDFGRRTKRISPDTGTTNYSYDPAGNLVSQTDANLVVTNYTYDALNRLTHIEYPADSSRNVTYVYDTGTNNKGRLMQVTDATGTSDYVYNQLGQLTQETRTTNGQSFVTGYTYNNNQELSTITYPSGRVITYNRNSIGQVVSVTSTFDGLTKTLASGISYLPFGPQSAMNLGNGLTANNSYDDQYRLTGSTVGSLYNKTYDYFATGHVQSITDNLTSAKKQTFTYDDLGRLTNAQGVYGDLGFTYDNVGNRLTSTVDTVSTTYNYVANTNRLSQIAGAATTDYTYDTAGNISTKGTTGFNWDEANRLTSIEENSNTLGTYGYDARGLRTSQETAQGTILSVYDTSGNLLAEVDATGAILQEYVYLNGQRINLFAYLDKEELLADNIKVLQILCGVDTPVEPGQDKIADNTIKGEDAALLLQKCKDTKPSSLYYYSSDHLGTAQIITDERGDLVWQGDYSPFGQVNLASNNHIENKFRFPGQMLDSESGLYYNWHRFYDPTTGRYITPDPIGLAGGINLYAYVGGGPVNAIDPMGLDYSSGTSPEDKDYGGPGSWAPPPGKKETKFKPCCDGEKKVPIWVCNGRLGGDNSSTPWVSVLSHTYITCENPFLNPDTDEKFGKHPRRFGQTGSVIRGPGYVNREVDRDARKAKCKMKMVCPDDKERMCGEGATNSRYFLGGVNCHTWGKCSDK